METTIDKAGRVVIPAAIRERAGLNPGALIDVRIADSGDITISRKVPPPKLVKVSGITVVRAQTKNPPKIDVNKLIREERDRWPL
jgi:AbrB family looped-hinge helix DNA binding protein